MYKWSNLFPDNCPPEESVEPHGKAYRMIEGDNPTSDDFICHKIKFPDRNFEKNPCDACSISLFDNIEDVKGLVARVQAFKNHKIAFTHLSSDLGKAEYKQVKIGIGMHISLWAKKEIVLENLFQC